LGHGQFTSIFLVLFSIQAFAFSPYRHFVKEQLPRIQYVNPDLQIEVTKVPKSKSDVWRPEMLLEFRRYSPSFIKEDNLTFNISDDGSTKTLDLQAKWSTTIVKELMETAGGESWARWKAEANASGSPLVPGEELQKTPKDFVS
jgi:small subunit ribosomal protein S25